MFGRPLRGHVPVGAQLIARPNQNPTASHAASAAPSDTVSATIGRTTETSSTSAWNCISRLLAVIPPSTRSVAKEHACPNSVAC
jgi:hypothetical protein